MFWADETVVSRISSDTRRKMRPILMRSPGNSMFERRRLWFRDRQWHRYMLVNCLPFVVVFRMEFTIGPRQCLRCLVGLESQISKLVFVSLVVVPQSVVTEHQIVVCLQVFRRSE